MTDFNQTTRLQRAVSMEHVPQARWRTVIAQTVAGSVVAAAGVGMLYGVVRVYIAKGDLSMPLFIGGVGLFGVGMNMASKQLFVGSVKSVIGLARSIKDALLNGKDKDAAP